MTPTTSDPLERNQVSPHIRAAINRILQKLDRWPLVLWGSPGTGKTCAALLLLDYLCESRWYWTAEGLADEVARAKRGELYCVGGGAKLSVDEFWRFWGMYRCVCVDEIGTRQEISDHAYDTLQQAIDRRYHKPAIFISNLSLNDLAKVYDARIASRLAAGTVVECSGKDRRLARKSTNG